MNPHNFTGTADWDYRSPDLLAGQEFFGGTTYGSGPRESPLAFGAKPWAEQAACVGQSLAFDATDGARAGSRAVQIAKAICAGCPALDVCRTEVMSEESGTAAHRYAVRAGMTPGERADLWMLDN